MNIKDMIQQEVRPQPRMVWDGIRLTFKHDVTVAEIDGIIERLHELKKRVRAAGIIEIDVTPPKLVRGK